MYENTYRENATNGNIIIYIALDDYMDFFHEWDNSTFKKRDMHPDLAEFLDLCSEDIPLKKKLELQFCVKNEHREKSKEDLILASYRNYYEFFGRTENKKIKRNFLNALFLVFFALVFILLHTLLIESATSNIWSKVFLEGLLIGGWVFMWEALHMASFGSQELFQRSREIKRFLKADVSFQYKSNNY
ncbi:MAG: hypothetical protein WCI30_07930 [Clostridia bacterium]